MMTGWTEFFLGEVGAAAAMAGLLFVAIAENRERILHLQGMADRGIEALIMLFLALITASFTLMSEQPDWLLGGQVALVGAFALAVTWRLQRRYVTGLDPVHLPRTRWMVMGNRLAVAVTLAGGMVIAAALPMIGLRVLGYGILLCFCAAAVNAWVLLVEINR